jgi:hypothetical protein
LVRGRRVLPSASSRIRPVTLTRPRCGRLTELGVAHRYEEFDDNHSAVDCRMDVSLPFLAEALAG